jgi:hypothetical protein
VNGENLKEVKKQIDSDLYFQSSQTVGRYKAKLTSQGRGIEQNMRIRRADSRNRTH